LKLKVAKERSKYGIQAELVRIVTIAPAFVACMLHFSLVSFGTTCSACKLQNMSFSSSIGLAKGDMESTCTVAKRTATITEKVHD
jgi:hypothetical protein